MRYAVAAILLAFGLACLLWPGHMLRTVQGNASDVFPSGYARASRFALRLVGLVLLTAVPVLFWLGYAH